MIKLYDKETTDFTNNGLGILKDVLSCIVEEEKNSTYSLTLEYPQSGFLSDYLTPGNIIKAPCGNVTGNDQLFEIKAVSNTLNRKTITARHIFYSLTGNMLEDVYPQDLNGNACLEWLFSHTAQEHNFTVLSDITTISSARYVRKNIVDALIGTDNCFIKNWGGELLRDNFNIKILQARGQDRGVKIRYGKNVSGITWDIDESAIYTRIYPIGYDGLAIPEKYIDSPLINSYSNIKAREYELKDIKIDVENGISEEIAKNQLRDAVQKLYESGIDKPVVNISIDFIELAKVKEYYEKYSSFESIYLGDTVQVIIPHLNLNLSLKVVKTTFNCLTQKYEKFDIGEIKENYVTSVLNKVNEIVKTNNIAEKNILADAKSDATEQITNAMGGYIYKTNTELYIMDTDNLNTAQKIWRWNINGLGYSSTGINGPYGIAMTSNGQIVADFITAGELDGQLIKAGSIKAPQIDTNTLKFGGNNVVRNSARYFDTDWDNIFDGYEDTEISNNTVSKKAFFVGDTTISGPMTQIIQIQNGTYTISWKYKKLLELANVSIKINDNEIVLDSLEWKTDSYTFEVLSNTIKIEVTGDTDNSCYLSDLMGNAGLISQIWSSAPGESINGGVKIGSSIEVTSSASSIKQKIDNDGNRIINTYTDEVVAEFTDKGIDTQEIKADKGQVANILILDMGTQTWFSRM